MSVRRQAFSALSVTLAIQAFTSLAATSTSVLAPEIAREAGLSPTLIGVFVAMLYVGGMIASLASGGFIERYGPIRVSQFCVALCVCGLALITGPLWALMLAPVVIGLGYGPITPASSHLLSRTASPASMALTFSIKQTGVPLGAALAGALLPVVALNYGWRVAIFATAALGIVIALVSQPMRAALDVGLTREHRVSLRRLFSPLRVVMHHATLVELTLTGFVYAATQVCLLSFLVVYLNHEVGQTLVSAGLVLAAATVGGIVGRVSWGIVADRWIAPRRMLGALGVVAGACAIIVATFDPSWPKAAEIAVCALFGMTAIGWNGVQLAEVARHSPRGKAGAITGASGFITFAGVVVGPPIFALLAALTGSYAIGFVATGLVSLGCGVWLLRRGA
ncbi:MAG: MFS transporter [Betaproteobacteria bacterium]